jgi:Tannase and feruloyl esterase
MGGRAMLAVLILAGAAGGASAEEVVVRKTGATDCAAVAGIKLPDVRVTAAEAVAPDAASKPAKVTVPHCRVDGVIGTEIRFRVVLPDGWNGRFAMGGGGGFVGSVDNQVEEVANRGYATAGTDTGHQASGIQAGWALDHLERQVN